VPQGLLRLLDFLTLVGTAVAAEDVFRAHDHNNTLVASVASFQEASWGKAEQRWSEASSQSGVEMHMCVRAPAYDTLIQLLLVHFFEA
jgi:hypothetical protein